MKIANVYDEGIMLPEEILNLDPSSLIAKFEQGVKNITSLSLGAGYPIEATIPIILGNAFRNIAAISLETGYFSCYLDTKSRKSSLLLHLPQLPQRLRPRLRPRRKRKRKRRRSKLRLLLLLLLHPKNRNKIWTWAICSVDLDRYLNPNNSFYLLNLKLSMNKDC